MKYKWLSFNKSDKLIVFFNGWGMDENVVSHLDTDGYDVVVLYDYNDLDLNIDLGGYSEKYVVCWSMGVMIAGVNEVKNIVDGAESITAVCGTPYPIHDEYGIPTKIYDLTINGFNEKSSEKFVKRMFLGKDVPDVITKRSLESQKSELIKLKEYRFENNLHFDKVIVPDKDVIIPTKNQMDFWKEHNVPVVVTPSGHCPFLLYNKWAELIYNAKEFN